MLKIPIELGRRKGHRITSIIRLTTKPYKIIHKMVIPNSLNNIAKIFTKSSLLLSIQKTWANFNDAFSFLSER